MRRVDFAGYLREARALAATFVRLGLTRDDVVAVQLPNCVEFAIVINAAMIAGIPFCQFHHGFRAKEVEFVLRFGEARAIVVRREHRGFDYLAMLRALRPKLPKLEWIVALGDGADADVVAYADAVARDPDALEAAALAARRPKADDLCRMAFTSGTTGDPKAVVHSHNTSNSTARSSARDQRMSAESAMLLFLPVGLNWGIGCTMQSLFSGAKLVYMDRFDAAEVLHAIERERVTHFATAPASLIALIEAAEKTSADHASLEVIVTGGASCPVHVLRRAQATLSGHVVEMYGMLESGVQTRTYLEDDPESVAGTVGRPALEAGVRVCDGADREVAAGTVGQIECFGPSVMLGYYNNPAANELAFSADGWFRTGDLGVFDERGLLRIVGRTKEMIIRGGANIYPRELEEVLFEHPKIADCAVVGAPHPRLGETAVACVVLREHEKLAFDELIAFLRPRVAQYKLPERLVVMDDLPRTPTGKVQKNSLAALIARA